MRYAIVTGITSLIGISLSALLSRKGVEVIGIVRPDSSRKHVVSSMPNVTVLEKHLSDVGTIDTNDLPDADCFFHLGWDSSFPNQRYNPEQAVNVDNTMKAVYLAHITGCKTFVGTGSQAECGRVYSKIDENTPDSPENEYGIAKVRAVKESMSVCEDRGIRCIWPRILSTYGPFDRPHTMIMSCIDASLKGKDMELTPCEQIWDYIYVDDAADALLCIAEKGKHGVRYPIGSGDAKMLKEYVGMMSDALNRDISSFRIGSRPYPEGQPMYLSADISTLTEDTGFRPKTRFNEGIMRTVKWKREQIRSETVR